MQFIDRRTCIVGLSILSATAFGPSVRLLPAQPKVPLVGTVGPSAMGPAAPTAVPIGGLHTRPLRGSSEHLRHLTATTAPGNVGSTGGVYRDRDGQYYVPVRDAPLSRYGVVVTDYSDHTYVAGAAMDARRWIPSTAKPRWVVDTTVQTVDAWRDVIVTDVVCRFDGMCAERQQHLRARWIAGCGCYAFFDAWNRLWRVK